METAGRTIIQNFSKCHAAATGARGADSAFALGVFAFRGYDSENVTNSTFTYSYSGATVNGTGVTFTETAGTGTAIGQIVLNDEDNDISTSSFWADWRSIFQPSPHCVGRGNRRGGHSAGRSQVLWGFQRSQRQCIVKQVKPGGGWKRNAPLRRIHPGGHARNLHLSIWHKRFRHQYGRLSDTSLVIHDSGAPSCDVCTIPHGRTSRLR